MCVCVTKAKIYFIPSFRQYKLPTFSRGRFFEKKQPLTQNGI